MHVCSGHVQLSMECLESMSKGEAMPSLERFQPQVGSTEDLSSITDCCASSASLCHVMRLRSIRT